PATQTGPWTYGWDHAGVFTPFNTFSIGAYDASTCFAGVSCWFQNNNVIYSVPVVAKNTTGATIQYGGGANTVTHPADVLNLHPGGAPGEDAFDVIVRFTAPTTSVYTLTGFFETLDRFPT